MQNNNNKIQPSVLETEGCSETELLDIIHKQSAEIHSQDQQINSMIWIISCLGFMLVVLALTLYFKP